MKFQYKHIGFSIALIGLVLAIVGSCSSIASAVIPRCPDQPKYTYTCVHKAHPHRWVKRHGTGMVKIYGHRVCTAQALPSPVGIR